MTRTWYGRLLALPLYPVAFVGLLATTLVCGLGCLVLLPVSYVVTGDWGELPSKWAEIVWTPLWAALDLLGM